MWETKILGLFLLKIYFSQVQRCYHVPVVKQLSTPTASCLPPNFFNWEAAVPLESQAKAAKRDKFQRNFSCYVKFAFLLLLGLKFFIAIKQELFNVSMRVFTRRGQIEG